MASKPRTFRPLTNGFCDTLYWNDKDKSQDVLVYGKQQTIAHFHTVWSSGTAGIRANKPINGHRGKYYWEVKLKDRVFGTSMMFGLTTRSAKLHSNSFVNLIGENEFGWGLSHKGLIWHNGKWKIYTNPFRENTPTVIGCLYDGKNGTLTFYKDHQCLGVAFDGLNFVKNDLYPTICSTAAKTEFTLTCAQRDFINLQDRCRNVIRSMISSEHDLDRLQLPEIIVSFLKMEDDNGNGQLKRLKKRKNFSDPGEISIGFKKAKIPMPDL